MSVSNTDCIEVLGDFLAHLSLVNEQKYDGVRISLERTLDGLHRHADALKITDRKEDYDESELLFAFIDRMRRILNSEDVGSHKFLFTTSDVVKVISSRIQLLKSDNLQTFFTATCPFCGGGGFTVNSEKSFWTCFSCKRSGDAISFIQEISGGCSLEAAQKEVKKILNKYKD